MKEILLATRNQGKVRELEKLLQGLELTLRCLHDFENLGEVEETGATFEENALIKARAAAGATGLIAIADDSGLVVDALKGRPGVRSARFAGPDADDAQNNAKLLQALEGVPPRRRGAAFVCVMAAVSPDGRELTTQGSCRGEIALERKGLGGFGYDPLFYLPGYGCTMAELPASVKNSISHRAMAVKELKERLPAFLGNR